MVRSAVLFVVWALIGFVGSFALLYGFTPIGPLILLAVWLAYRHLPRIAGDRLPEAAGTLGGLGMFWLFVATTVDDDAAVVATVGAVAAALSLAWYIVAGWQHCGRRLQASQARP